MSTATALIVDDEPLLRERLQAMLASAWPALQVLGQARHGREALELVDSLAPDIVFLDVHMPGLNGVEVARELARRQAEDGAPARRLPRIVFVTAYEQYAVQAFEQGAVDYLVKPFDQARLGATVARLQDLLRTLPVAPGPSAEWLDQLAATLRRQAAAPAWLQWIKASVGTSVRLIPVDQVAYLRSDEKYTLVAWSGGEALIRKPIRELADELDPAQFVQVHRSVIVHLPWVVEVVRGPNETAELHLRGRPERLPVSRSYLHQFKQM